MYFFIDVSTNLASGCYHFRCPDFMSTAPTNDTILCYISSIMIQTATETPNGHVCSGAESLDGPLVGSILLSPSQHKLAAIKSNQYEGLSLWILACFQLWLLNIPCCEWHYAQEFSDAWFLCLEGFSYFSCEIYKAADSFFFPKSNRYRREENWTELQEKSS